MEQRGVPATTPMTAASNSDNDITGDDSEILADRTPMNLLRCRRQDTARDQNHAGILRSSVI
jgi:hypothetical protein